MKGKIAKPVSFEHSRKQCFRQKSLSRGLAWAHYQNDHEYLFYNNPSKHTLSFYLVGGYQTHRTDVASGFGAPGTFCLMPQDCQSQWQVGDPQQMVHLYFDDDYIKQLALKTFDIDPRTLSLPELTFAKNDGLDAMCRFQMATTDWQAGDNTLMMEQVTDTILVSMLKGVGDSKFTTHVVGGLAPKVLVLICDFIQAHFARQIYLSELANLAQLSDYHFCRMFKKSMAQTPQQYLTQVRIDHVKHLCLSTKRTLSDIALACGFSNQSHMGRYFKKQVGVSPRQFRQ